MVCHHLIPHPNEFTNQLTANFYVDNLCTGVSDSDKSMFELFRHCSMNLHSWATNDNQLRDQILAESRDMSQKISILGTDWNQYSDQIGIRRVSTKSGFSLHTILAVMGLFFKVCGFFTPLNIRAKILFQTAQAKTVKWDNIIPKNLHEEWTEIRSDLQQALFLKFDHFISDQHDAEKIFELHIFADASKNTIAAIAYICVINCDFTDLSIHFLLSRA